MAGGEDHVRVALDGGVARVVLARPERRNAFDDETAARLDAVFADLERRDDVRLVVLAGEGETFCAGGDVAWMRRVAGYGREENLADAAAFQRTFERIDRFPAPVVGRVQGAALGGGAGLVAVCDIVVAAEDARLGFPEVRLGLVPGVISPYVIRKIGEGAARHLFVTGAVIDAVEARRLGLVHVLAPSDGLDEAVDGLLASLEKVSPDAARRAKRLALDVAAAADSALAADVARRAIVDARASEDGREGTQAFLDKRPPRWSS